MSLYGKYPKISNTKVFDICKQMTYANSADLDQTLESATLFAMPLSILRNSCIKSTIQAKIVWNKVFPILGHLP